MRGGIRTMLSTGPSDRELTNHARPAGQWRRAGKVPREPWIQDSVSTRYAVACAKNDSGIHQKVNQCSGLLAFYQSKPPISVLHNAPILVQLCSKSCVSVGRLK